MVRGIVNSLYCLCRNNTFASLLLLFKSLSLNCKQPLDEKTEVIHIEKIIAQEPELIFRLLAMVNSLEYRGIDKITSIKMAIVRFGLLKLRSWVLLFMSQKSSGKPDELITNTLIRANSC